MTHLHLGRLTRTPAGTSDRENVLIVLFGKAMKIQTFILRMKSKWVAGWRGCHSN